MHARPLAHPLPTPSTSAADADSSAVFAALVRERRSVHAFDPAPIADEDVRASLELALLAPSSFNLQPYEFIRVRDPERRSDLARLCLGQRPAQTAQELIVCVARWDRWRETAAEHDAWLAGHPQVTEAQRHHHAYVHRRMPMFFAEGPFNIFGGLRSLLLWLRSLRGPQLAAPGSPAEHRTWAVKSAALACAHAMLALRARGLDSCAMEGFDHRRVARFLGLRGKFFVPMIIAVGRRGADDRPEPQWRRAPERMIREL